MDHVGHGVMGQNDYEGMELPGGYHLERDQDFGYFKVIPRLSDEELAEYYGNHYLMPITPHDHGNRVETVCSLRTNSGRVLDIGCGVGDLLEEFRDTGWDVVGVEPGKREATIARSKGINVIEDMLTDSVAEQIGMFDAVFLINVLEHSAHPEELVGMIQNLLVPGGIFCCEVPNDFNSLQEVVVSTQDLRPWWITLPAHLNYFSIESLSAFIAGQGFEVVHETTDFPVEMFLVWGDIYVDNLEEGARMHAKRCRFEEAMRQAGKGKLLQDWYDSMAKLGIGRKAIVYAKKQ